MFLGVRNAFIRSSNRLLSSSKKPRGAPPPKPDVDIYTNPTGKYLDTFMKYHGNDRSVFKKEDIVQWINSFDEYTFKLTCLKGTDKAIGVSHFCTFYPIEGSGNLEPIVFTGFGWTHPEHRQMQYLKLQHDICYEVIPSEKINVISHINEPARKFWHLMIGLKENEGLGHRTADVQYKSVYDAKNLVVPRDLDIKGITVKSAKDVPAKEIIEYDQTIHPYHREKYIISHMYDRDGFGKVAYDEDGKVIGIGQAIIYNNKKDCNLGPIYADEPRVAQAMFKEMLQDIKDSGKFVSQFEIRSTQKSVNSFHWMDAFLQCEPNRSHVCNLVYKHWAPKNVGFDKVYCPTHAQLFIV
ncbi:hypothetical protein B9Z55_028290 [Caenorhabditis nigoni]|uniref:DUF1248 domain-containing protein n=1 Tax=Caenorhabditis nigoni TaxID=1611254 RepID=A0A2G5SCJ7_9PELO|nr:hypothetical protein B9Z55_028290 [Caenorhabditis nigoni]